MDRRVDIKINGTHLSKDGNRAGVRGEANVTYLRISFDDGRKGYAKHVTFWNAKGKNPVTIPLTADMLEDITSSTCIYLCPIPGEALTEGGMLTFIIDGYTDGKRQRSVSDELEVISAPLTEGSSDAQDPTPTEAERLQAQIDSILDTIANEVTGASAHAESAAASAGDSATYAANSLSHAESAAEYARMAADNAAQSIQNAAESARLARESAVEARISENAAAGHAAAAAAAAAAAEEAGQVRAEMVRKTGDTMTGGLSFAKVANGSATIDKNHTESVDYGIDIRDASADGKTAKLNLCAKSQTLLLNLNGVSHGLYGEHNKPSGSYAGNGDAAHRTIAASGNGIALVGYSSQGTFLATFAGVLCCATDGQITYLNSAQAYFTNGVFHILTSNAVINAANVPYSYQVI